MHVHKVSGCLSVCVLQPSSLQRALFHQVISSFKPCSDPNLSVGEKGTHTHTHSAK